MDVTGLTTMDKLKRPHRDVTAQWPNSVDFQPKFIALHIIMDIKYNVHIIGPYLDNPESMCILFCVRLSEYP